MRYANIISKVYGEPWLILPEKHRDIQRLLESRLANSEALPKSSLFDEDAGAEVERKPYENYNGIAIVPVDGIIGKHLSMLETMCGGCDLDDVNDALDAAAADPLVHSIVLNINSPGGTAIGVPETGAKIAAIAKTKTVIAYTDYLMCSAGYWLASQATEIYSSGSAMVGSIGTYIAFMDSSRAAEMQGLKLELFKAGRLKAMGLEGKATTDEEREYLQAKVDRLNAHFVAAATANRELSDETMQGQSFSGDEAKAANLVDGTVPSLNDLLALMARAVGPAL